MTRHISSSGYGCIKEHIALTHDADGVLIKDVTQMRLESRIMGEVMSPLFFRAHIYEWLKAAVN